MQKQQLIDWIQLINTANVGPVTFYKLLNKYGSAKQALQALSEKQTIFSRKDAEYEIEKAERNGIKIFTCQDSDYPQTFNELNDAPPILYVKGRTDIFNYPAAVSVVGSRNASITGRKIASKIAYDLTEQEVLIVSGMARGIDSAAHKGALYAKGQTGTTIAVLGTGVDVPYPTENTDLYHQICEQGAVISEFPLGTGPQTNNFPRRNRLVSALTAGTLVVEASLNSGSLITARLALEQGKDIFAVPGSPIDGKSAGSNKLIREGAILTESADDILEVLSFTQNRQIKNFRKTPALENAKTDLFEKPLDNEEKSHDIPQQENASSLLSNIPSDGVDIDTFIRSNGLSTADAMMLLTEWELDGLVERSRDNRRIMKTHKKDRKS